MLGILSLLVSLPPTARRHPTVDFLGFVLQIRHTINIWTQLYGESKGYTILSTVSIKLVYGINMVM